MKTKRKLKEILQDMTFIQKLMFFGVDVIEIAMIVILLIYIERTSIFTIITVISFAVWKKPFQLGINTELYDFFNNKGGLS